MLRKAVFPSLALLGLLVGFWGGLQLHDKDTNGQAPLVGQAVGNYAQVCIYNNLCEKMFQTNSPSCYGGGSASMAECSTALNSDPENPNPYVDPDYVQPELNGAYLNHMENCFTPNPRQYGACGSSSLYCVRHLSAAETTWATGRGFGNGDQWIAGDDCSDHCTAGDFTFFPCDVDAGPFSQQYGPGYWQYNCWNGACQQWYPGSGNLGMCPTDVRKLMCGYNPAGEAYSFMQDGTECVTNADCYQGPPPGADPVKYRPNPSECITTSGDDGTDGPGVTTKVCTAASFICGNGVQEEGEKKEIGSACVGDADCCGTAHCVYVGFGESECSFCGNGSVDAASGEICDDGDFNGADNSNCAADCKSTKPRIAYCCNYGDGEEDDVVSCLSDEDCDPTGAGGPMTYCFREQCMKYCDEEVACPSDSTCDGGNNVCIPDCIDDPATLGDECTDGPDTIPECDSVVDPPGVSSCEGSEYRSLNSCHASCAGGGGMGFGTVQGFYNCLGPGFCVFQEGATTGYETENECATATASMGCGGGGTDGGIGTVNTDNGNIGTINGPGDNGTPPPPPPGSSSPPPPGSSGPPPPPPTSAQGSAGSPSSPRSGQSSAASSNSSSNASGTAPPPPPPPSRSSAGVSASRASVSSGANMSGTGVASGGFSGGNASGTAVASGGFPGANVSGASNRSSGASVSGGSSGRFTSSGRSVSGGSNGSSGRSTFSGRSVSGTSVSGGSSGRFASSGRSTFSGRSVSGASVSGGSNGSAANSTSSGRAVSGGSAGRSVSGASASGGSSGRFTSSGRSVSGASVSGASSGRFTSSGRSVSGASVSGGNNTSSGSSTSSGRSVSGASVSGSNTSSDRSGPALSDARSASSASVAVALLSADPNPFASSRPFGLDPFASSRPFGLGPFDPSRPFGLPVPLFDCGDGALGRWEECDDANRRDGDGCSAQCLLEFGRCGDGAVQSLLNEQCEPGVPSIVPCRADCRYLLLSCGNGKVDPGESCDLATGNANLADAFCRADCSLRRCGDRITDSAEQCDDGNRVAADGCSPSCLLERQAGTTEVLPGMLMDLPLLPGQNAGQVVEDVLLCNAPTDCAAGSICAAGVCTVTPQHAPAGETGPAAAVLLGAAGAAAGYAWVRRRGGNPS